MTFFPMIDEQIRTRLDYVVGENYIFRAKDYLDKHNRLDLDSWEILDRAFQDCMDAEDARRGEKLMRRENMKYRITTRNKYFRVEQRHEDGSWTMVGWRCYSSLSTAKKKVEELLEQDDLWEGEWVEVNQ